MSRGGGRGALMRKILEMTSSSEENSVSLLDSGLGDSKDKQTIKIDINDTKDTTQSLPPAPVGGGRGRARLIELITQQSIITTSSGSDKAPTESKSKFIGRGKMLLESETESGITSASREAVSIESEVAKLNISDEKPEPDAVVKRGKSGRTLFIKIIILFICKYL